jgi:hypothetical protein
MEKLKGLSERVDGLSIVGAIEKAFSTSAVKSETLKLNREQLNEGKGAHGEKLSTYKAVAPDVYALFTVTLKKMFGQPHNKVTLKDTGEFHSSLKVQPFPGHALVIGDTKKANGDMEDNIDVSSTLGIMPDNMQELIMSVIPEVQKSIRSDLRI